MCVCAYVCVHMCVCVCCVCMCNSTSNLIHCLIKVYLLLQQADPDV